ncbi:YbjN domain-containing protein [Providencia alcalifaciens]|uniref:YbjN domain-containing protein n=2 Tax=Providencia alcalifaciens TaxID=126385 RepID=A0AAW9V8I6_9GAMM|nr:YbjN domain-containing protein [Providencia alcalifaciens]EUD11855.1 putative bacterial sensory transduction regulator [Providencia alcalifaciens 205/92]MTC15041.1 YbjN domain-containing protein [Providencia alcalifaciens]MTC30342.1 YbjN domain-containing protein [Providencia alcalifaciens]MTC34046.1 YbjN domain-containing protein [Providencia alcalifaciens]MTC65035.1 YbjN domain-containing protein [Providencia alcalifaciens]
MDSICYPDISQLREWLDQLKTSYFECDSCAALHLPHMQNIDGIFDAKLDIINNVLVLSALAELKPTAIITLVANISQINASSLTAKVFLEINNENLPKLVVSQSFSLGAGMTYRQFSHFIQEAEEQISSIVFEIFSNNLLYANHDEFEEAEVEDDEVESDPDDKPSVIIH